MKKKDLFPDVLEFEIGAYDSDSSSLQWLHNSLVYLSSFSFGWPTEGLLFEPNDSQWKLFWRQMDRISVWDWAGEYYAPVNDGTGWSLDLSYNGRQVSTYGHMAYPDPDDVSLTVEFTPTQPFEKLLQSLDSLCGTDDIL